MSEFRHTFPREEKIRKKKDRDALFKKGKVCSGSILQLFFLPRGDNLRKAGFAFSRGVTPATKRNRLRRLLSEAYRLNKEKVGLGYNLLLKVKKTVSETSMARFETEFLTLARKAGLLRSARFEPGQRREKEKAG